MKQDAHTPESGHSAAMTEDGPVKTGTRRASSCTPLRNRTAGWSSVGSIRRSNHREFCPRGVKRGTLSCIVTDSADQDGRFPGRKANAYSIAPIPIPFSYPRSHTDRVRRASWIPGVSQWGMETESVDFGVRRWMMLARRLAPLQALWRSTCDNWGLLNGRIRRSVALFPSLLEIAAPI